MRKDYVCLKEKPMCKAMDSPEHSLPIEMKGIMKVHVICDTVHLSGCKGNDGVTCRFGHLYFIAGDWSICSKILKE